jgi:hypothetical protein
MLLTIKINYATEEQLDKLSELLEIPKAKVVELILSNVLNDQELLDKIIN